MLSWWLASFAKTVSRCRLEPFHKSQPSRFFLLPDSVTFFSHQVTDFNTNTNIDTRLYIVALIPGLLLLGQVRNLKYLVPFSLLANCCMISGFVITLYYIFTNVRSIDNVKLFSSVDQLPRFFATVIFAIEGIGVVSFTIAIYSTAHFLNFFHFFFTFLISDTIVINRR